MADGKARVFISAVTGEFESARNGLGADLRARDCDVTIQSDFKQGPDSVTLLKTLYDYIRDCHGVVCLIGKRTGAYPPAAAAERFKDMLPSGMTEASYTQWEYLFARHFNRRLYIYVANDDWKPDKAADPDNRQEAFVQYLKDQGVHRTPFSTVDQLARAVLKEEFSAKPIAAPQPHAKPIVLPYPSLGPLFKGREGFLRLLHDSLARGGNTAITSKALYGLGGIGKTRAAVEYAWAHRDDYSALLFVVAETPEALRRNLAGLAATLMPGLDTTEEAVRLQAVLNWLGAHPGWSLILDNVDTKEALAEAEGLLAKLAGGHLVMTSRLSAFSANFEPLALDVLTIDDAAAFLLDRTKGRRRTGPDDSAKARELAVELDGLALMLEQAGAHIAKHRLTFADYLDRWRSAQHDDVLKWFDTTVTGYSKAVAVTWQTSVAQLTEPGRRLLERLAWLAPEKVPEFLLDVPVPDAEAENLHDALDDLAAYSLVTRDADGPYFLVHRLVQDVTRRGLAGEQWQRRLDEAVRWINAAFPADAHDVRAWERADALAPHARAVLVEVDGANASEPAARLMNEFGLLLYGKALYAEAEPLYQRSLAIYEQTLGPDHPNVGNSLNNLAGLYRSQGRYAEAEPLYRRSLAIREKALGKDHPDVGQSLNNLALLHHALGRNAEAEPLSQRALAIGEKALGPDHPNVGTRLNNLAALYRAQGRYAEAEPLYRRSLAIIEMALGPDHPDVGTALNNLAEFYRDQGNDAELEPLYQRSLAIREKALGPNHPDIATPLNNLAQLYRAQGRMAEAKPLYRRCIGILLAVGNRMGRLHPNLEPAIKNYAGFLSETGKSDTEIQAEIEMLMRGEG